MVLGDGNTVTLDLMKGEMKEKTFELQIERWIQTKQNISGLGNIEKKSRGLEDK